MTYIRRQEEANAGSVVIKDGIRRINETKCGTKRVQVTHLCNLPELESIFENDAELKVSIDDQAYWPQNEQTDCSPYGVDTGACIVPKILFMTMCFPLKNAVEKVYTTAPTSRSMRITVTDVDIFSDDHLHFFIPAEDWYDDGECGGKELEAKKSDGSSIKVTVFSAPGGDQVFIPMPTPVPITPMPTPVPITPMPTLVPILTPMPTFTNTPAPSTVRPTKSPIQEVIPASPGSKSASKELILASVISVPVVIFLFAFACITGRGR